MDLKSVVRAGPYLMLFGILAMAQTQSPANSKEAIVNHAQGPFDVKITPQEDKTDPSVGRMTISKQYHGDLEGTGVGEMLTASTEVKGSGVYVAVEKVTGKLQGRARSFLLHHTGVMTRNARELSITVVPDSGTGQLTGIAGTMNINIAPDGKHSYDFVYTLPNAN